MKKYLNIVCAFLFVLTASGCASNQIKLHIRAANYLNPNLSGVSEPVRLQIYQLSKSDQFVNATIANITNNPDKMLGKSLLDKTILNIKPKAHQVIAINNIPGTEYIGVIAYYRDTSRNTSKQIIHLQKQSKNPLKHKPITIMLNTHNIIITN